MSEARDRSVVFQPTTYQAIQRGVNRIVCAISPTLGPRPRLVAIKHMEKGMAPELLDNGGTIARRIIQLSDRSEDVGAMILRETLLRLADQVGDGTAMAAVLFGSVFNEGVKFLASGGNAPRLKHYLEQGYRLILETLSNNSLELHGQQALTQVAGTVCYDNEMASMMGEIFDIIGDYGRIEIRSGNRREYEREYVEGMYWEKGLFSSLMATDPKTLRVEFENAAILISDLEINEPQQLFPVLEVALKNEVHRFLMVVGSLSESSIAFLLRNKDPERFQVAAVKTPGWDEQQRAWALEDLSILTGGRVFYRTAGETFRTFQAADFGKARRIWADTNNFGIIGGKGNPRALRRHIATLKIACEKTEHPNIYDQLQKRIGKLLGGSATLWVGGTTEHEIQVRLETAKRTAAAMRGAIREGVLPGGGVALMACRPILEQRRDQCDELEGRAAYSILIKAMESPLRTIVSNAGSDPGDVMAEIRFAGNGWGFNAKSGKVVNIQQAGIFDPTAVTKAAVYAGIAGAAMALSVDVLVHRREQPEHASIRTLSKRKKL